MNLKYPILINSKKKFQKSVIKKIKIISTPYPSLIKVLFFLIFTFSNFTLISAQVIIKEKIEIKPESNKLVERSLMKFSESGHSLRAVHDWEQTYLGENNDIPMSRMRFRIKSNSCNQVEYSDFDYSGNLVFTLTELMGASYTIELLLSQRTVWDPIYRGEYLHGGGFQVYVDGEYAVTGHNSTYVKPWFGYLGIDIAGSEIYFNDDWINVYPNTGTDCSPIIGILNKDWPTVTIINGQDYLSFYDEVNDDTIGNSYYSGDFIVDNEFPKIIYDEPYIKNDLLYGIVKVEVNGVEAFDTLQIMKAEDLELEVQIIPEEISPNEEADIFLKELTPNGTIDFDSDQLFSVDIIDGAGYGTILSSNGTDTSDSFTEIEQGFKFVANSELEFDSVEVLIKVSAKIIADEEVLTNVNNSLLIEEGREQPSIEKTSSENEIVGETVLRPPKESFIFIPPDEDREIFGVGSVKIINSDSIDHFHITILPDTLSTRDTIAFTETARIFVQAKDADSNNIEFDSTKLLSFKVTTNTSYGTFISSNGDTLKTEPVILENISYADARTGKIKFAAVKENPDSILRCNIKISLRDDSTKNGNKEAIVLEQTLKIVMEGDRTIRPIITSRRYDLENDTYLSNIGVNNRESFSILITRGGRRLINHRIKLKSKYIKLSGGHDHILQQRPYSEFSYTRTVNGIDTRFDIPLQRVRQQNYGSFYSYVSGEIFNIDSLKGMVFERTGHDTVSRFEFVASIFGDSMRIFLESLENNQLLKDSVTVVERILSLESIGTNNDYELIGGTSNHIGPPGFKEDHNHYGTSSTNANIRNLATEYRIRFDSKLSINDMSLPYGGKFDLSGDWRGSHVEHRIGRNADIRSRDMEGDRYLDANRNGVYDPQNNQNERLLNDLNGNGEYDGMSIDVFRTMCLSNHVRRILFENPFNHNGYAEHWHLEF